MGGEHGQLAHILNKDSSGQYYALTCSLSKMDNCIKAASGLLDYARDNFSTQLQNNTGFTPLGIAFSQYVPIEYIGLTPPVSLVTPEVVQYRNELASRLKENEYYQQKFYSFLDKEYYPVKLDDVFINAVHSIISKANSNVAVLMQAYDGGAADCFNFPDKCKNIKAGIDSQLQDITTSATKLLEDMKYTITTLDYNGILYNTGGGYGESWKVIPVSNAPGLIVKVRDVYAKDKDYGYVRSFTNVTKETPMHFLGDLAKNDRGEEFYYGTLCTRVDDSYRWYDCYCHTEKKQISTFFFETFNTEWCD